jgi:hypothetical protein
MRRTPRPLISLALAATAAILFGTCWALWTGPAPVGVVRLPDGSVVRLEAVTFGARHQLVLARDWQRVLAPLLPPSLQARYGGPSVEYQGAPPGAAVFWFTAVGQPPFTYLRGAVVYDDRGEAVPAERAGHAGGSFWPGGEYVDPWVMPVFPRRGSWLHLRVNGPDGVTPWGEFQVRNPAHGPYPIWRAGSLPQTRREGPLAFSLTRLTTGPIPNGRGIGTQVAVRVTEHGRAAQRWEPVGITLSDATGNLLVAPSWGPTFVNGSAQLQFPEILPLSEAAWKVRAEFVPARDFSADDLLTVPGLAIPSGSSPSSTSLWVTRYGVRQHLHLQLRRAPWLKGQLLVELSEASPVDGVRIGLLRATDERGRSWQPVQRGPMFFFPSRAQLAPDRLEISRPSRAPQVTGFGEMGFGYELRVPADARRLSLTLAVVKSRFVDFLARPSHS